MAECKDVAVEEKDDEHSKYVVAMNEYVALQRIWEHHRSTLQNAQMLMLQMQIVAHLSPVSAQQQPPSKACPPNWALCLPMCGAERRRACISCYFANHFPSDVRCQRCGCMLLGEYYLPLAAGASVTFFFQQPKVYGFTAHIHIESAGLIL